MMPAGERKRAPEMAEGDGWLDMLRDRLREQRQVVDEAQDRLLLDPNWLFLCPSVLVPLCSCAHVFLCPCLLVCMCTCVYV
jgi:hypothetical protein